MTFRNILKVGFLICVFICFWGCQKTLSKTIRSNELGIQHENGKLFFQGKLYSGIVLTFNNTGDTNLMEKYENGIQEGESLEYYDNQKIRAKRYFHLGKKNGEHIGYWRNGSKRFLYHFKNDIPEGNQKEWNDLGVLISDFNYKNGQESGAQKMWYENGMIRMNYTVVNGRRYGLQGTKNCDTVNIIFKK